MKNKLLEVLQKRIAKDKSNRVGKQSRKKVINYMSNRKAMIIPLVYDIQANDTSNII